MDSESDDIVALPGVESGTLTKKRSPVWAFFSIKDNQRKD